MITATHNNVYTGIQCLPPVPQFVCVQMGAFGSFWLLKGGSKPTTCKNDNSGYKPRSASGLEKSAPVASFAETRVDAPDAIEPLAMNFVEQLMRGR